MYYLNYEKYLAENEDMDNLRECLKTKFLFVDGMKKAYIWGTGILGKFTYQELTNNGVKVCGFLDNNERKGIVSYKSIEKDSVVIVASFAYPEIKLQLENIGIYKVCYYEILPFINHKYKTYYMGFQGLWQSIFSHKEELRKIISLLSDDISRKVIDNILCYRLSFDDKFLDCAYEISEKCGTQYFDKCISLSEEEVFADCGGYIGDTSIEFIKKCNEEYQEIHIFEPDKELILESTKNLNNYHNIYFINKGVDQKKSSQHFTKKESKGGGSIDTNGEEVIETISLDEYFEQKEKFPTYIKMDIEGFERYALLGAKTIITEKRPKMAISIYHRPSDIFEIILFLNELGIKYEFYIRHYTKMYADTVLYCVPVK